MTREEFTKLCQMYLEPLSYNNIKTVIMKSNSEQSTAVYCGGTGVTKYDNGYITNKKGVYFPYSLNYDKRSKHVKVKDAHGKVTGSWYSYIKYKVTEDDKIKEHIIKLSADIRAMMTKERMSEIKNCGGEYDA